MECSNKFNLKKVVIADGDNFLLSMEAIETVLENLASGTLVAKTEGLPLGMNVIGWHASHLKSMLNENKFQLLETGWSRIFKSEEIKKLQFNFTSFPQFDILRFTTDYPEDLQFMQKMFHALGDKVLTASSNEIIKTAAENKFYDLNGFLSKGYFDNFFKKMNEEKVINHE
jgi:spore coat polysaccharide biosynthesis protein SpsF (cytidylyltransferase family)